MVKYVNISIPKPLYDRLLKALEDSGYRSPSEYIIFLLRKALPDLESEIIERRLEALGYKS
jgi:metal-responsive CopG/Arc/MetJ family transcriptional regulator